MKKTFKEMFSGLKTKFKKKEKSDKKSAKKEKNTAKTHCFDNFFSIPLLKQTIKSNKVLWLVLTLGSAFIFIIINVAAGTKQVFTNIDMNAVSQYVNDQNMNWLQIFGLLDIMGFQLQRIQVMSQIDLNSIMGELIFKIAGVLLPMIYVMVVGNKLLASQVSDGSMAYVLSTPTARKKVVRTQWFFMVVSLMAMYVVITLSALLSGLPAAVILHPVPVGTYCLRTLLFCIGSFCAIFALLGVSFWASAFFNKSTQSIAVGGGACVLAFICCILGLFANKVFVAVGVGVKQLDFFNYLTVFSLVDTDSMSTFSKAATNVANYAYDYAWIWKDAIAVGIGAGLSVFGGIWFCKKDLPL